MHGPSTNRDQSFLTRVLVRSIDAPGVLPLPMVIGLGVIAVAAITAVDIGTGPHFSLLAVFGIVVIWVGWNSSQRLFAIAAAALAAGGGAWAAAIDPDESAPTFVIVTNGVLRGVLLAVLGAGTVLLRRSLDELSTAARRDPLTGLLNRAAIFEAVDYERRRAERTGRPISIAYFDLDGLKATNDRAGHEAGDALIARFASALTNGLRNTDVIARLGGDEYVALLPETPHDEAAGALRRLLDDPETPRASCGLVSWTSPSDPATVLVATADRVMYEAKAAGGGLRTIVIGKRSGTSPETDGHPS